VGSVGSSKTLFLNCCEESKVAFASNPQRTQSRALTDIVWGTVKVLNNRKENNGSGSLPHYCPRTRNISAFVFVNAITLL
jgi:hypothetical protein